MGYTAREFEQYILKNRKEFIELSAAQERELGRLYIQFAEIVKLEADKIVNTTSLTYAQKKKLIDKLMSKAADLTDDFKGVLDKALIDSANLSVEADRAIMAKYQMRLSGVGIDVDLVRLLADIPDDVVKLAYKRIMEDGLKLSDRIWILNRRTQRELERIILEEIVAGRSASSKVLEARLNKLLNPDRRFIRTSLHGRNVSFDAARLLRSERAVAFREAGAMAAEKNPGNRGMKWVRSNNPDPNCGLCHTLSTQDLYGLGAGVYPPDKIPLSHPQCKCTTYEVTTSSKELTNNWLEWTDNKSSHPEITKWYSEVYRAA